MNNIKMGLEYEIQLMTEAEGKLEIVNTFGYFNITAQTKFPKNVHLDLGNIEISTNPQKNYFEAVKEANNILYNKLVPFLINKYKIKKFALFLPSPMCNIYHGINEDGTVHTYGYNEPVCMKHWNISFPFHTKKMKNIVSIICGSITEIQLKFQEIGYRNLDMWKYDFKSLINKGYSAILKDCEDNSKSRVHIKIPYHYSPPQGNPDLLPNFEDTIIPNNKWKNLLCYYKNNNFVKIRDLI